uniref:EF-hand domain-containing protein n=1 Tax=Rhabditophanes sp. KR3021 TaxID=114890 RepID=A0AC35U1L1_9BILA
MERERVTYYNPIERSELTDILKNADPERIKQLKRANYQAYLKDCVPSRSEVDKMVMKMFDELDLCTSDVNEKVCTYDEMNACISMFAAKDKRYLQKSLLPVFLAYKNYDNRNGKLRLPEIQYFMKKKLDKLDLHKKLVAYDGGFSGYLSRHQFEQFIRDSLMGYHSNYFNSQSKRFFEECVQHAIFKFDFFELCKQKKKYDISKLLLSAVLEEFEEVFELPLENNSNWFCPAKVTGFKTAFSNLDLEDKNYLRLDELKRLDSNYTDIFYERVFEKFKNSDNEVSLAQFKKLFLLLENRHEYACQKILFQMLDINEDGFLCYHDLLRWFNSMKAVFTQNKEEDFPTPIDFINQMFDFLLIPSKENARITFAQIFQSRKGAQFYGMMINSMLYLTFESPDDSGGDLDLTVGQRMNLDGGRYGTSFGGNIMHDSEMELVPMPDSGSEKGYRQDIPEELDRMVLENESFGNKFGQSNRFGESAKFRDNGGSIKLGDSDRSFGDGVPFDLPESRLPFNGAKIDLNRDSSINNLNNLDSPIHRKVVEMNGESCTIIDDGLCSACCRHDTFAMAEHERADLTHQLHEHIRAVNADLINRPKTEIYPMNVLPPFDRIETDESRMDAYNKKAEYRKELEDDMERRRMQQIREIDEEKFQNNKRNTLDAMLYAEEKKASALKVNDIKNLNETLLLNQMNSKKFVKRDSLEWWERRPAYGIDGRSINEMVDNNEQLKNQLAKQKGLQMAADNLEAYKKNLSREDEAAREYQRQKYGMLRGDITEQARLIRDKEIQLEEDRQKNQAWKADVYDKWATEHAKHDKKYRILQDYHQGDRGTVFKSKFGTDPDQFQKRQQRVLDIEMANEAERIKRLGESGQLLQHGAAHTIHRCRRCHKMNPSHLAYLIEEAGIAYSSQSYAEALKLCNKAILMDKTNHVLFGNKSAILVKVGRFQEAVEEAEYAINLEASWSKAYFRKGEAHKCLGNVEEAMVSFAEGLAVDVENDQLLDALIQMGLHSSIKDAFGPILESVKALHLESSPFVIISVFGQELLAQKKVNHAVRMLLIALRINSDSIKLKESVVGALSKAYHLAGNTKKCIECLEFQVNLCEMLDDFKGIVSIYKHLSVIYVRERLFKEGIESLKKALNCERKGGLDVRETLFQIADIYLWIKDWKGMDEVTGQMLNEIPEDGEVYWILGRMFMIQKEFEKAEDCLDYGRRFMVDEGDKLLGRAVILKCRVLRKTFVDGKDFDALECQMAHIGNDKAIEIYHVLSEVALLLKDIKLSKRIVKIEMKLALETIDNKKVLVLALSNLSKLYIELKDSKAALKASHKQMEIVFNSVSTLFTDEMKLEVRVGLDCALKNIKDDQRFERVSNLEEIIVLEEKLGENEETIKYVVEYIEICRLFNYDAKKAEALAKLESLTKVEFKWMFLNCKASESYNLSKFEDAITLLTEALMLVQEDGLSEAEFEITKKLGQAYESANKLEESIIYYEQVLSLAKELRDINGLIFGYEKNGKINFSLGNMREALECVKRFITLTTLYKGTEQIILGIILLGEIYCKQEEWELALQVLLKGKCTLDQTDTKLRREEAIIHGMMGKVYLKLNKKAKAMRSFCREIGLLNNVLDYEGMLKCLGFLIFEKKEGKDVEWCIKLIKMRRSLAKKVAGVGEVDVLVEDSLVWKEIGKIDETIEWLEFGIIKGIQINIDKDRLIDIVLMFVGVCRENNCWGKARETIQILEKIECIRNDPSFLMCQLDLCYEKETILNNLISQNVYNEVVLWQMVKLHWQNRVTCEHWIKEYGKVISTDSSNFITILTYLNELQQERPVCGDRVCEIINISNFRRVRHLVVETFCWLNIYEDINDPDLLGDDNLKMQWQMINGNWQSAAFYWDESNILEGLIINTVCGNDLVKICDNDLVEAILCENNGFNNIWSTYYIKQLIIIWKILYENEKKLRDAIYFCELEKTPSLTKECFEESMSELESYEYCYENEFAKIVFKKEPNQELYFVFNEKNNLMGLPRFHEYLLQKYLQRETSFGRVLRKPLNVIVNYPIYINNQMKGWKVINDKSIVYDIEKECGVKSIANVWLSDDNGIGVSVKCGQIDDNFVKECVKVCGNLYVGTSWAMKFNWDWVEFVNLLVINDKTVEISCELRKKANVIVIVMGDLPADEIKNILVEKTLHEHYWDQVVVYGDITKLGNVRVDQDLTDEIMLAINDVEKLQKLLKPPPNHIKLKDLVNSFEIQAKWKQRNRKKRRKNYSNRNSCSFDYPETDNVKNYYSEGEDRKSVISNTFSQISLCFSEKDLDDIQSESGAKIMGVDVEIGDNSFDDYF